MSEINFYNVDCIQFMKDKPDNYYDLAIVDPPYGIGVNKMNLGDSNNNRKKEYKKDGKVWDSETPPQEYFDELFRVSKNQVIFGANYMIDKIKKPSMGWIYWDKQNGTSDFSDGELAFTSFNRALRSYKYHLSKDRNKRFHPTQKPADLYRWIIQTYTETGNKILDTHGGSMTHAIACDMEGFDLDICEIDKEYFDNGVNAFKMYKRQLKLF